LLALLWAAPARADSGSFGIGLILGQPTAITGANELSDHTAIDAALGLALFDGRDFYLHVEFLYTLPALVSGGDVSLSPYLGIGGWTVAAGKTVLGARAPFGLSLDFNRAPVQIFLEASLLVALVPDSAADIRGALGFRYYF
jgi:hypothetical protein